MTIIRPVFRIFDYNKAIEFYIDWLGFQLVDTHSVGENFPLYLRVSMKDIEIHLTEHYEDSTPGSKVYIENFIGLVAYQQKLSYKNYKYYKPEIEKAIWNPSIICMQVIDPFGNKIVFTEG